MPIHNRNREASTSTSEFYTPDPFPEDINAEFSEDFNVARHNREINRRRGKWFGKTIIGILTLVAVIGLLFSWIFLATVDEECDTTNPAANCGFYTRFGLSYFILVQEFILIFFVAYCVFVERVTEYRLVLLTFLNITGVLLLKLTTALSTSAGLASNEKEKNIIRLASMGFVFLAAFNCLVMVMLLIPKNSILGFIALDSIPLS